MNPRPEFNIRQAERDYWRAMDERADTYRGPERRERADRERAA